MRATMSRWAWVTGIVLMFTALGASLTTSAQQSSQPAGRSEPFQAEVSFTMTPTQPLRNGAKIFVPEGKRLVIEYATATTRMTSEQGLDQIQIRTTVNGTLVSHPILVTDRGRGLWVAAQTVKIYADPGTAVDVFAQREVRMETSLATSTGLSQGTDSSTIHVVTTLSGYLEDRR